MEIIIGIAIIYYFVSRAKRKKREQIYGNQQGTSTYSTTNRNQPARTTQTTTARPGNVYQNRPGYSGSNQNRAGQSSSSHNYNGNFAVVTAQKKVPPNVERDCRVEDKHRSENNVSGKSPAKPTAVPNVQRSYTQAPKETREQKKASRMIAKRLYEGDRVPQGYHMVKCSYCAAENLIAHSAKGAYMCYFCHTDLK